MNRIPLLALLPAVIVDLPLLAVPSAADKTTGGEPAIPAKIAPFFGHSYGGKKAMFASCLYDKFSCAAWSDGGIVFDEKRANVNYWEPTNRYIFSSSIS